MGAPIVAQAYWLSDIERGELRAAPLTSLSSGQARVRTLYSGISRGTESLIYRGQVPADLYAEMCAPFQEGAFPAPLKYGYINVGRVEALGEDSPAASQGLLGCPVFCLYPHQDCYQVPVDALHPLPPDVPPARAVLAANLETAINAIWDARVSIGDRVLVVGGGVVGLLTGWLCARLPGVEVQLVDPLPAREEIVTVLGMAWQPEIRLGSSGLLFDVAIHASGHPEGLARALPMLGDEGRLVELSWYGTRSVEVPLGVHFHPRRLQLIASQVGQLPPDRRPRWTHARRLQMALSLLREPLLDRLITDESPFNDLPAVMRRLATPGAAPNTLCHRIRYPAVEDS